MDHRVLQRMEKVRQILGGSEELSFSVSDHMQLTVEEYASAVISSEEPVFDRTVTHYLTVSDRGNEYIVIGGGFDFCIADEEPCVITVRVEKQDVRFDYCGDDEKSRVEKAAKLKKLLSLSHGGGISFQTAAVFGIITS